MWNMIMRSIDRWTAPFHQWTLRRRVSQLVQDGIQPAQLSLNWEYQPNAQGVRQHQNQRGCLIACTERDINIAVAKIYPSLHNQGYCLELTGTQPLVEPKYRTHRTVNLAQLRAVNLLAQNLEDSLARKKEEQSRRTSNQRLQDQLQHAATSHHKDEPPSHAARPARPLQPKADEMKGRKTFIRQVWQTAWLPQLMGTGICAVVCSVAIIEGLTSKNIQATIITVTIFFLMPVPIAALATLILRNATDRKEQSP